MEESKAETEKIVMHRLNKEIFPMIIVDNGVKKKYIWTEAKEM